MNGDEEMEEFRRRTSLPCIMQWSIPSIALLTLPITHWLQRSVTVAMGVVNPLGSLPWEIWLSTLFVLSAVTTWTSSTAMTRCVDFHEPGMLSAIITLANAMAFVIAIFTMLIIGFLTVERLTA